VIPAPLLLVVLPLLAVVAAIGAVRRWWVGDPA
jgi:hypothetical protein